MVLIGIVENNMETTISGVGSRVAVKELKLSCHKGYIVNGFPNKLT